MQPDPALDRPRPRAYLVELGVAAVAGWGALALPVLLGRPAAREYAGWLPVMNRVVEQVNIPWSTSLLFSLGMALGAFGSVGPRRLGLASVSSLFLWSIGDMVSGADHNLFPFEWAMYALYGACTAVGAMLPRRILRMRGSPPSRR